MNNTTPSSDNRRIRIFVSSTFRDMVEDRNSLMTHAWPELRRFCRERRLELVEVDLRWGISEEQSTRKETLKLCLDEIRACRPYFIGLLGERYGWVPDDEAFTADLLEEQPWLVNLRGRSVTELEIIHGVLREEQMHGRAFFYFRDPAYLRSVPEPNREDFTTEDAESTEKLERLKQQIRAARDENVCHLRENYPNPRRLAESVLEDLRTVIDAQFPIESIPDVITRAARDQEAFAETRRRTYIGRLDYFVALDRHAASDDGPLVLLGDSGSGKSSLLANWIDRWRKTHPRDFIFQHYIGGTPMRADHWALMFRLVAEIKRWTGDSEDLPRTGEDILKVFDSWLVKLRNKAERASLRAIVVLDALNQLEDDDHARLLSWLPSHPFTGPLRLVVSTLPVEPPRDDPKAVVDDPLKVVQERGWISLCVQPLTPDERCRMVADYLKRFGKKLDTPSLERIAAAPATANPLYLKILLDELRVTGTHDRLDERLGGYLAMKDIPSLLDAIFARYERDYELDRSGLVREALALIWAARCGLTEAELLFILRPMDRPQLPVASWTPLRSALEESLVDRAGVLNFAHDFFRVAVARRYVAGEIGAKALRLRMGDALALLPTDARQADELPWLLRQVEARGSLRACLLDIDRFLFIMARDQNELLRYWVWLGEEKMMGKAYLKNFERWARAPGRQAEDIADAANTLAFFLFSQASLHAEAEPLFRRAQATYEQSFGLNHPHVATALNNLALLLLDSNRLAEAESLLRRALAIDEQSYGVGDPTVATPLINLAALLKKTNRLAEAEPLLRRALSILERAFGENHPQVAMGLGTLSSLLQASNRIREAELTDRRVLEIMERNFGETHPNVAVAVGNLGWLLKETERPEEAEPLLRRALAIAETSYGANHPRVAVCLNNLAQLLHDTRRLGEAEPLMRRALAIDEQSYGTNHPRIAVRLNNLSLLLKDMNRLEEAERLMQRANAIEELDFGRDDPDVANELNDIARSLLSTEQREVTEPWMRRMVGILLSSTRRTGTPHPRLNDAINGYAQLLRQMGLSQAQIVAKLKELCHEYGLPLGGE
ncbi:MAG: tetratricopeptide repeat protein [Candidatus Eisenbacteria bacterium]|nr:tetratricopeptide repeat protein [Candidatus Eisenbacteria bacterium]